MSTKTDERVIVKTDGRVILKMEIEFPVWLPEDSPHHADENGTPTKEARERAIEAVIAVLGIFGDYCDIYIDGKDKRPARVFFDVSDNDVTEVRVED